MTDRLTLTRASRAPADGSQKDGASSAPVWEETAGAL
jgi:hypothetical protein